VTTKRIRIAVAIASDGMWSAAGWSDETGSNAPDATLTDTAFDTIESIEGPPRIVWVEAEVPVPEAEVVVEGEVK